MKLSIKKATPTDLPEIRQLLESAGLPIVDIGQAKAEFFLFRAGEEAVGMGGLERYGRYALLRSVMLQPSMRGTGMGREMTEQIMREAKNAGVETIYLLTTTARAFFEKLGYVETQRTDVPGAIKATAEFASICPASATVMFKSLTA